MTAQPSGLRRLREWYFGTPIYRFRLAGRNSAADVTPVDLPWPGDPEDGRATIDGAITTAGVVVAPADAAWDTVPPQAWRAETLHGFVWLRDLVAAGGEAARLTGRSLINRWIDRHDRWHPVVWRGDVLGERLCSWISTFDFFCGSADQQFRRRVLGSVARQAAHAPRDLDMVPAGVGRLRAIRGLIVSGIAFSAGEKHFMAAEAQLLREIEDQFHADGGHRSRSPARHCEALVAMIDIRNGLRALDRPVPAVLDQVIHRMAMILRIWRHGDNGLALFHQSTARPAAPLDSLLAWSDARSRTVGDATETGFQRLAAGRTCVILDTGMPTDFDVTSHASPLAMEVSVGRQRLIVNCGANLSDEPWSHALRASAAHSMLVIDKRDATAAAGALAQPPARVTGRRNEDNGHLVLETEHDGYRARFGLTCRRWLCLSGDGQILEGLDRLVPAGDAANDTPAGALIRFHLHPDVTATLAPDGRSASLALPSNDSWRLWSDTALAIEESVYFGDSHYRPTTQVVITKAISAEGGDGRTAIRWALHRDDGRYLQFPLKWRDIPVPDDHQEDDHGPD